VNKIDYLMLHYSVFLTLAEKSMKRLECFSSFFYTLKA